MFSAFSSNAYPAPQSYGESPSEDAREAHQATASRLTNGSSATPRSQHLAPNPTSSAVTLPPQPVLVRTPSSPQVLTATPHAASPTPRAPRLPPVSSFTFAAILRAADLDIRDPVQAIAEICAKSRISLADEHGAHIPPQGEIRRRLRRPEHALAAVPEAEGSRERLAERREKSGELWRRLISKPRTVEGLAFVGEKRVEMARSRIQLDGLERVEGLEADGGSFRSRRSRGLRGDGAHSVGTGGAVIMLRGILDTATARPPPRTEGLG